MARLIDADVANEMLRRHANEFSDVLSRKEKALLVGGGASCIDKCPTVDAVEVVHGRWQEIGVADYKCSRCGFRFTSADPIAMFEYCRCGAKMDGGNGDA
jgi:hypothetical protein